MSAKGRSTVRRSGSRSCSTPRTAPTPRRGLPAAVLAVLGLLGGLLGAVTLAAATATPAAAHATVLDTVPGDGESVATSPPEFRVTFSETVDSQLGGLTVLNRDGERVDAGAGATVEEEGGRVLRIPLDPDLDEGTYVGTWRVVSADGHPISGSALFAVGTAVDPTGLGDLTARTDPAWEVAGAIARFVTFTAALLAAGLGFFVAFLHDQRRDRWNLVPVVRLASVVGLLGIAATIACQASLATGRGFDAVGDVDVLRTVLTDSLGWSAVVLLVGLALTHLSTNTNRLLVAQGFAFYGWATVSVSFVLWGHASEAPYRWLTLVSDGAHAAAAALWFGGLVGLALVLRRRGPVLTGADAYAPEPRDGSGMDAEDTDGEGAGADPSVGRAGRGGVEGGPVSVTTRPEVTVAVAPRREVVASTATILGRFSTAAMVSVVVLLVAGVTMTYVYADGSPTALWSTTYGRLVLAKVLLVAVVLVLAAHNRQRLVPQLLASASGEHTGEGADPAATDAWSRLRRSVLTEALVLVLALAVTAVVVNVTPARTATAQVGQTIELRAPAGDGTVELTLEPARAGRNTIAVQYLDAEGQPLDVANSLRVEFSLPDAQIGPLGREVVKTGAGSFIIQGSELSIPGTWQIALVVRPSDFRELRTPFTVDIA